MVQSNFLNSILLAIDNVRNIENKTFSNNGFNHLITYGWSSKCC